MSLLKAKVLKDYKADGVNDTIKESLAKQSIILQTKVFYILNTADF